MKMKYPQSLLPQQSGNAWNGATMPVQISCFGGLKLCIYGRDIQVQGWKSPKVYQLLALIVAMGGKNIAAHQLCDAIWPDGEGDKGMQNLEFILRRLRQVLQADLGKGLSAAQVIQLHQGKISLNPELCELDSWQWQQRCEQARMLRARNRHREAFQVEQQAATLLTGALMQGDQSIPAMHACQSDWISRCCHWLDATLTHWRNDEQCSYHDLAPLFEIWFQLDPTSERCCLQRMRGLLVEGYSVDARRIYFDWVQLIKERYGMNPSAQAVALANKVSKLA